MTSKITMFLVAGVVALGMFLGFSNNDNPHGSKTPELLLKQSNHDGNISNSPASTAAITFVDSLNGLNDTTSLKARGYKVYYRGAGPQGLTATWFQGNSANWPAFNGPATGYVSANYNVVTATNNIDSWLVLPRLNISAGDSLMFWERTVAANPFPDSMRIMYSAAGDSTPEAGSWVELGRFRNTETGSWAQRKYRLATAGANGRIALRYNVVSGGPTGDNSNLIGVDMITVSSAGGPPPSCTFTWSAQTSGTTQQLFSVSAVSDQIGWAAGAAGTVRKTTNGGTTWTDGNPTPGVISGDVYNIYAWSANDAICTTSPAATFIYKTTNGGTNWVQVYTLAGGFIDALQMISPTEGYGVGDPVAGKWTIVKTTNGGTNWARMATEPAVIGSDAGWNNSLHIVGTDMWFGTNGTKVYHSTDLGVTWTFGATTGTVNTYAVHYNSVTTGLAGGTAMVVSTNGGANYSAVTSPGTTGNLNGIEGAGSDWWALRSDANIYRSTNGASTWTTAYTQAAAVFQDIDFTVVGGCPKGWAAGNLGVIAKMDAPTGISNANNEVPSSFDLKQNFPNPFNPTTNINFSLPKSGFVTLKVYDMIGKEVATLVNEVKTAGNYIVGFNAANLPSGAYFYRLESNSFVDTKKMMLIK